VGTSVTRIVEETGISASTVSRLISQWTEAGQIREAPHPEDGRRRTLGFSEEAHRLNWEWALALRKVLRGAEMAPAGQCSAAAEGFGWTSKF
jgi:DNA-binding MarR family transcriptional regulator